MKILVLTTWYPSVSDPVRAIFVRRHVEALALLHDVTVLHLAPPGTVPVPPDRSGARLRVEHVNASVAPGALLVGGLREAHRWVRLLQPDLVHTMGFSSLAFAPLARGRTPWVHSEHWSGVTEPQSAGRAWHAASGARHLLRLPRALTVVSSDMAMAVAPFARRDAVHVVGNVVEPTSAVPRPDTRGFRLLSVGGLNAIKDPVLAVRTVRALLDRGQDVRLRWAGSGPLLEATRRAIHEHEVEDLVELLGQVDPAELGVHHAWSTEFFLPTRHETFCVAAAEALAHGRPVVVGARGGQRDFVTPELGRLVAGRDPETFATALEDVRTRLRATPPEAFAARISRSFSPTAIARRFDEVYASARDLSA